MLGPEDLNDSRIGVHEDNQFEVKLDYTIATARRSRYVIETYLFVPRSLGIDADTYRRDHFHSDIQAYLRFKTPCVSLRALADEAVGSNIHEATVDSSGNDYGLMNCVAAIDSGGFVSDPPADTEDYVMTWTFPESGEFTVETSGTAAVLGVAPSDCEAEITTCDDECFGNAAGFVTEGRAGETVHLIVETFDAGETFSLSIQPGATFMCETESGDTDTSDGTGGPAC